MGITNQVLHECQQGKFTAWYKLGLTNQLNCLMFVVNAGVHFWNHILRNVMSIYLRTVCFKILGIGSTQQEYLIDRVDHAIRIFVEFVYTLNIAVAGGFFTQIM